MLPLSLRVHNTFFQPYSYEGFFYINLEDEIIDVGEEEYSFVADDGDDNDTDYDYQSNPILSFLNDCLVEELALIPGLSEKKAAKLESMRPFESMEDLVWFVLC